MDNIAFQELESNIEYLYYEINDLKRRINDDFFSKKLSEDELNKLKDELLEFQCERNQLITDYDKEGLPGKYIKTSISF
jgi:hypothetical protein